MVDTQALSVHDHAFPPVTVTETAAGIATGIEHLAAAHRSQRPARSHPSLRRRPPALELGDEISIPDTVRSAVSPSSVTLRVPASAEHMFVAAPLVYYLGADIELADCTAAKLESEAAGFALRLPGLPDLQEQCAKLLRRTFFLDCVVRSVDAPGLDPGGEGASELRNAIEASPRELRSSSPGERLHQYLAVPAALLEEHAPEWHLSTYVAPIPENLGCLPSLLDALSLVYLPRAERFGERDLLDHTLADAYERGRTTHPSRLKPQLRRGQLHSWLAPGAPVGAVKATAPAIQAAARLPATRSAPPTLTVVCNETEMRSEIRQSIAAVDARETSPVDLEVLTEVTTDELAAVLTAPNRLVHYIGHCDDEGLRCVDGWLDTADLSAVRARSFVLNACGSYEQGLELVDNGSVAGAVTLRNVLDDQASVVGSTLVRLLLRGFDVGRAVDLASRRVLMGADYVAIGDGTFRPLYDGDPPTVLSLERDGDDFTLRARPVTVDRTGQRHRTPISSEPTLNGNAVEGTFTRSAVREVLGELSLPVIYDDRFYWSGTLAATLTD